MTAYSLFNKAFRDYSSNTAIILSDGSKLSFSEVRQRAARLASVLEKEKLKNDDIVAILMDRGPDNVIAIVTCLLYGYAFIPMDTEYPRERVEMILSDSKAAFVIDNAVFSRSAFEDPLEKSERKEPGENDPAYAVFTSGSTGRPKGILHDQRCLAEAIIRNVKIFKINNNDIWGVTAPLTFVIMVGEVISTLASGSAINIIPRNTVKDPELLSDYIDRNNITAAFIAPRTLRLFRKTGTSLRLVVSGGEKLCNVGPEGYRLVAIYGQSETCSACVFADVDKHYYTAPFGKPVDGSVMYLLDENGNEADEGEICISGYFMTEYINLPELTATTITDNPFRKRDGNEKLIHTGDLGKKLENGEIVFVNRKDWMIKINGQRVEPGEIETVLKNTEGINEAAVKSFVNRYDQTYICAYYTGRENINEDSLRSTLQNKLPSYMVPSFFVRMDAMPVNNNGKLDRLALNEPDVSSFLTEYVEPETETESLICMAFEKVLGLSKVGILDDFFKLGGDSIKAVMTAKECSQKNVSVKHILCGKTPKQIALLVSQETNTEELKSADSDVMPLTDSQMGVYLDICNDEPDCRYNIPFVLSFPCDSVDPLKLRDSLEKTIRNHQAFSLCVAMDKGCPVMKKNLDTFPETDIIYASEGEYSNIKANFVKPFDIGKGPLFRALIVKTELYVNLLFDVHHVIFDGSSLEVFQQDICDAYEGKNLRSESITPFIVSACENSASGANEKKRCLDAFMDILSGNEINSNINPDLYIPELNSKKGLFETSIDVDVKSAEFFTHSLGITENTLFASAFAYALAKFTCQSRSLFVSVESGRSRTGMDRSVGMFVKSFPVLVDVDDEERTADYLKNVQKTFFESMALDSASFADVVHSCDIDAGVKFVYQAEILNGIEFRGRKIKVENLPVDDTMSNLDVMVIKQNGSYKISIGYRASMYSREIINSFASSFNLIVDGLIKCSCLKEIKLTDKLQESLIDSFNDTDCNYNLNETVVDLFKKAAALYPDNEAVVFNDKKLSYREFDSITDRIAAYILSCGIKPDSFVPVITSRSIMMPVLSWGVVKAGCAYQPLDPTYPQDRLNFMVSDSGAEMLIAERSLYPLIKDFKGKILFADEIADLPECKPDVKITPENRLVLLYTSGTTGLPKGVVIKHRNVVNLVYNHVEYMEIDSSSRYATYASFGFDAYLMDAFSTLCTGATLCIIPEEIRLDLNGLDKFYSYNRITHGFVTTQLGCMFAQTPKPDCFRALMTGGEKLIPFTPSDSFTVFNGYGPSETIAYVTKFKVQDNSPIQPIGKATGNTKLYIVDKYLRRMPAGACGELIIAGPQVSGGYLNRPEKTSEVFIENPFSSDEKYSKAYRSGDITRFLPDGNVEFIGRRDGQVKIRGFRIELTEVQQIIRSFDGIKNATVQAFDDPNGGKFIAAYITSDRKIDIDELNAFIESTKPAYMVPAVTMQLDEIPLNPNGKVDKRKLPAPVFRTEETVAPKTKMQKEIIDIVSSVLGSDKLGITSDFFKAGLTSLGTIRLNSLLSDKYETAIRTADLKENSTVEKLERFIINSIETKSDNETAPVVYPDYPVTKIQEGIFIECINNPDSTFYNIPYLIKLSREIDLRRLKLAVCETVSAHSYINTTLFYDKEGNVRQKLAPAGSFSSVDIEEISAKNISDVRHKLVKPFTLIGGRLFRICIIKAEENYIYLDFHHIISDGTSMLIFISDIEKAYGGETPKQEKYTGFDVSLNEQKLRNSHAYIDAEDYYKNLLGGADTGYLPHSDMHSYSEKGSGKLVITGQNGLARNVGDYCRNKNVSENSLLCTAFGYVLAAYNGSESSMFTTVYNGRNDSRMSNTVSMLVKTLPVVFSHENDSVTANIKAMSDQLLNSMANDVYSFAEISREFSVSADVMFIYQGNGFEQTSFCGRECSVVSLDLSDQKAPVCVQMENRDGSYRYTVECDPESFTDDFARSLVSVLDCVVAQITEADNLCDIRLADENSTALMDEINRTDFAFDRSVTVVDRLRNNAEKYPDYIAVSFKEKALTYRDFDRITDNLASWLVDNGAKKNSFVAILIGRNEAVPVAAWGIVKAGAAYLPIDPTYPKERIDLMLSDSNAQILITERGMTDLYSGFGGKVLFADEFAELPDRKTPVSIDEEDPFILIYSSGSTGIPKGSILPHRSLNALIISNESVLKERPGDRVGCYASFGFDAGLMDIFNTIVTGATLYIIPEELRLDIPAMDSFFIENGITHSFMTTQVARTFVLNTKCRTIRNFLFGGEKMIPFNPPEGIEIYNGYGPSETNCYVTLFKFTDDRKVQPIGKQSVNTKLYVIDKNGKRLPPYCCGELCIAGPQVALGYLNRPEKNAQSFVMNPFCDEKDYSVMYRTGDIVRMFADGNYDFVGRRDGQVKIRGFRIELGEVEQIISSYPGIRQVTVQAFDNPEGGKFMAAYYVADEKTDPDKIADFIRETKPGYMVPSFFTQLDSIPLTSNGKVNKAKLPKAKPSAKKEGAEPVGETETKLCELFAATLGADKVYADDDFFDLGGTSISALQLVVKCVNAGFQVVYKNLFENPTPRLLAKHINGELESNDVFAPSGEDAEKYDYSALEYNVTENLSRIRNDGVGDVLLTGATGFLGIHVLRTLLETTDSTVTCLVRSKDNLSVKERLKTLLEYYFENDYASLFETRVFLVDGELSDGNLADKLGAVRFDTIINCAANVHHFGTEEALMRDNYNGIRTLINIAKSRGAKLVQTSSISVCGESINGHIPSDFLFRENNLNIGQSLENLYVRTKYLAEQEIINAVSRGEIRGKIVRFGNLMARNADGEFQINAGNNGFLNLINGIRLTGCYPVDSLDAGLEFTPIDYAAKALVLLAGTPDEFTVFHANSAYNVHMANILNVMNEMGFRIDYVEPEVFATRFAELSRNEELSSKLSGILSYLNNTKGSVAGIVARNKDKIDNGTDTRIKIGNDNSYTVKALYRLGFSWPITDNAYITKLVQNLRELNFFD